MRIAVIDSGVNPRHPHITSLAGGVSIGRAGSFTDTLGHGTAVMAAIQEKAPTAEYFAVKLFHEELRASSDRLLEALEWALENRMGLVNLSLGTHSARRTADFERLVAQGVQQGMRMVAAAPCYPGCLKGVAAVELDWEIPRGEYRIRDGVYYASGYPRPAPDTPPQKNLHGISFAVANVTGLLAKQSLERMS